MVVGYGLTESTATVSCTLPVGYDIGSVGVVLPGIEVKIGEDNEILLRGKTITKGYYKKAEATAAAIEPDGWFHTGDAGYFKNGQLFLTERIKDLFKTSNGKYVAPQALETKLVIDRYIDQIAIIADQRKFVSALIVPVYGFVKEYAKEKGIEYKDMTELLQHPKIVGLFRARIDYGISVICAYLRSVFVFSEQICIAVIKIILVIVKAKNSVAVCLYIRICTYINAVACAYGIDGVHIRFIDNIVIVNFFVYVRFGDEIITDKVGIINCIKCSSVPFVDYRIIVFFISVTDVFDIQQITEIRYVHRCLRVYVNRRHASCSPWPCRSVRSQQHRSCARA